MRTDTRRLTGMTAIVLTLGVAACGSSGDDEAGTASTKIEQAFLQAMTPHHESAVEMAQIARRRGEHGEIKKLAASIIEDQEREITEMAAIHERLFDSELQPDERAHEALGLSAEDAGGGGGHAMTEELKTAKPFDKAFIDEMVPHHQGAIRMAEVVLENTDDPDLEKLARGIISAQTREISDMNEWRTRWYGAASPAGGVPPVEEKKDGGEAGGEHDGGHSG